MHARRRTAPWTLTLVSAGGAVMTLDVTVVNVALSAIARDLGAGLERVQWTVSAYSLAFGALILTAGALSDRIGRRRVFTAGMALFTLASVGCGLAPDAGTLVAARALQGLGGALVFAPALALLAAAYRGPARRAAIAAFAAVSSAAGALGPVIGGALVQLLGWRWVFLVNLPIGVLVVAGALLRMPESATPDTRRRVDPLGALLAVGALLALHYPLVAGPEAGWTAPEVVASAVAGAALALGLVVSQRRGNGLIDVRLLRIPAFSGAALLGFLARMSSLGVLAFLTLWLQGTSAHGPLRIGMLLLPLTGSMLLAGLFVARLQQALSSSALVACGFALQGCGLLCLAAAGAGGGEVVLTAGLVLLGTGGALIFPPLMGLAVSTVPADRAGMASGLTNACSPLGTATGVAVFGALFSARLDAGLGPVTADRAAVETGRFALVDPAVRTAAQSAFSAAFVTVCLASAAVCLLAVLLARVTLRTSAPPVRGVHPADDVRRAGEVHPAGMQTAEVHPARVQTAGDPASRPLPGVAPVRAQVPRVRRSSQTR